MLVLGGGSGIGRGVVEAYMREGARVTVLERSDDNAEELRLDFGDAALSVVAGDATEPESLERALEAARDNGPLVNVTSCVGIFDSYASLRDLSPQSLTDAAAEIWRANVLSALLAANQSFHDLQDRRGSITFTLSESAFAARGGGVLYGSSKWALRGVISHLARDFAPEVRVNGVAPGGTTHTRLSGARALGASVSADQAPGRDERIRAGNALRVLPYPEDHAAAYVYLADPTAARVVTGAVINTDGGGC